jgi:hypothetical protein
MFTDDPTPSAADLFADDEIADGYHVSEFARGKRSRLGVWDVRDDDDYGDPTRRMIVVASSPEDAEALWDCPFTEHNTFARPLCLKGWQLEIPGPARVLYAQDLVSEESSEAA